MLLLTSLLLACTPALDGDWEGPLDCGADTVPVDMAFELEDAGGGRHLGEGFIAFTETNGTQRELTFEVDLNVSAAMPMAGEVDLSIQLDDCHYDGQLDDCYAIDKEAWDSGDDVITGDIDSFLTQWDCDFELER